MTVEPPIGCNVLLSAAGRRPYLVEWFREALAMNEVDGQVLVCDSDPVVAAATAADHFLLAPRADATEYPSWLAGVIEEQSISLAVSINDFELSVWAGLNDRLPSSVIRLSPDVQRVVEDKWAASRHLIDAGISAPWTGLGREVVTDPRVPDDLGDHFVVKNRFGSGSRGMQFATRSGLEDAVREVAETAYGPTGEPAGNDDERLDMVIVQPRIEGTEFGVDTVSDLESAFADVLVRRKLSMRGGETDKAVSEAPDGFRELARSIARAVPHAGVMDCDVIVDSSGRGWVIDLNARIGGGYPFSHVAGAHVPAAYVGWALGREVPPGWLHYRPGQAGAKYIGVSAVDGGAPA